MRCFPWQLCGHWSSIAIGKEGRMRFLFISTTFKGAATLCQSRGPRCRDEAASRATGSAASPPTHWVRARALRRVGSVPKSRCASRRNFLMRQREDRAAAKPRAKSWTLAVAIEEHVFLAREVIAYRHSQRRRLPRFRRTSPVQNRARRRAE